jgi:hypothetical protein
MGKRTRYGNSREKHNTSPPWSTGPFKDKRKDTKFMKKVSATVDVRESEIHGKGVFATDFIPSGKNIAWYRGPIYSCCQVGKNRMGSEYHMTMRDGKVIDGSRGKHWSKYINDAIGSGRECNLYIGKDGVLTTSMQINAGEELLLDYGDDYWILCHGLYIHNTK